MKYIVGIMAGATLMLCLPSSAGATLSGADLAPGEHLVNLGEVSINYVVRGKGPITFVEAPGWGIGSNYLQNTFRPLEEHATLVYIDPRGSGGSSRPADRARMSQRIMADDIDALRAKLGLSTINLLGHSDSGTIVLEYAEHYPERLNKLVVVDGWITGDPDARRTRSEMLDLWTQDPRYAKAVTTLRTLPNPSTLTNRAMSEALTAMGPLYVSDPDRFVPQLIAAHKDTQWSAWANAAEEDANIEQSESQLAGAHLIRSKTLIINGTSDVLCPYIAAKHLHDALPGSALSLYINTGHFPWLEQPRRFFTEVGSFLSSA